jgi:hypothetical protein
MRSLLLMIACSSSTPMDGTDMAVQSLPDLAVAGGLTDAQRCSMACAKLATCGVDFGAGCSAGCQGSNTFLPCLRSANLDDCNALALCTFAQSAHDFCPGGGGIPNGTGTCNDAATCEGNCNVNQPGVAACGCACVADLLPAKAINLLINNQCAITKCPTECGPTGSGVACNTCHAQKCMAELNQCASQ